MKLELTVTPKEVENANNILRLALESIDSDKERAKEIFNISDKDIENCKSFQTKLVNKYLEVGKDEQQKNKV